MFPTHHHLIGQNGHGCSRSKPHFYQNSPHLEMFDGEVEADESYFGGQRKGKRGRGAAGKVAVFGLLKRMVRFIRLLYQYSNRYFISYYP